MHDLSLLVFLGSGHKCESEVCNGCHDISVMAYEVENIAVSSIIIVTDITELITDMLHGI